MGLWDVDPEPVPHHLEEPEAKRRRNVPGGAQHIELPRRHRRPCGCGHGGRSGFPTGCHKVGASPALAPSGDRPVRRGHKAVALTGNYCRGGAFNSGCWAPRAWPSCRRR